MAMSTNGIGSMIDEFEEVSGQCLTLLLENEPLNVNTGTSSDKNLHQTNVEQRISKFLDLARQVDNYFLQSAFFISVAKPEFNIINEVKEMREEIIYKDKLIQKYEEKIKIWKNVLSDNQRHPPPAAIPAISQNVNPSAPSDHIPVSQQQYLQRQTQQQQQQQQQQQMSNVQSPMFQLQQKFQAPPRFP